MSEAQHTPGPWEWHVDGNDEIRLATPDRGRLYVLGFIRKGMHRAQPTVAEWTGIADGVQRERFGGVMVGMSDYMKRYGMHPDARLIAAAPDLLRALLYYRDQCTGAEPSLSVFHQFMETALAKATGETA